MIRPSAAEDVARAALVGRRELALLDEPSVLDTATLLARHCREPDPWVRAAVGTLDRFAREVADGDLPGLLGAGRADHGAARASLERLAARHDRLAAGQLAALAFGPTLWWTAAGVQVPWRPLSRAWSHRPLPGGRTDPDVRLLVLAVIGAGATEEELTGVPARAAGALDRHARIVPDLDAVPLAVRFRPADGGPDRLTFLSFDASAALHARWQVAGRPGPDDPLLLPATAAATAGASAATAARSLIAAGNDVNVTLCRATGDFFRAWGMPGARFQARASTTAPDAHR